MTPAKGALPKNDFMRAPESEKAADEMPAGPDPATGSCAGSDASDFRTVPTVFRPPPGLSLAPSADEGVATSGPSLPPRVEPVLPSEAALWLSMGLHLREDQRPSGAPVVGAGLGVGGSGFSDGVAGKAARADEVQQADAKAAGAPELWHAAPKAMQSAANAMQSEEPLRASVKADVEAQAAATATGVDEASLGAAKAAAVAEEASGASATKAIWTRDIPLAAGADEASQLPAFHQSLLRRSFLHIESGVSMPYYVGCLKSFSHSRGFGFLDCSKVFKEWGCDVFIHKRLLPHPWSLGQYVEFAVVSNDRGQPQAADVRWLPLFKEDSNAEAVSARAEVPKRASDGDPGVSEGPDRPAAVECPAGERQHLGAASVCGRRYLGVLKSFSPTHNYGFIASKELWAEFSRDIYFDRSQLPQRWVLGQVVEFTVTRNARGQPQARHMDWDPVPLMSDGQSRQSPQRFPEAAELEQLTSLLQRLSEDPPEVMVKAAVDLARAPRSSKPETAPAAAAAAPALPALDFVTFVLDRLPSPEVTALALDDRHRLLLLLLVALSLKQPGRQRLVAWFDVLARAINANATDHFQVTIADIMRNATPEAMHHLASSDPQAFAAVRAAVRMLQAKSRAMVSAGARSGAPGSLGGDAAGCVLPVASTMVAAA